MDLVAILRGIFGMIVLVGISYLLSENKKAINWRLVIWGTLLQLVLAVLILYVPGVRDVFEAISYFFVKILDFSHEASVFLFGSLVTDIDTFGFIFAFQVLPTIIFFAALSAILYYLGILQRVIYAFAWLMQRTMKLSGVESLTAAANIFIGQTEAPLLVRPYLDKMTRSELFVMMSGGMATIAGGVLAAYVGFLGGQDPELRLFFATHLLTASIISAPAAIVAAKIMVPETQDIDRKLFVPPKHIGSNLLDAITNGTTDGLKLAMNVGAMLIAFIALIAMFNYAVSHGPGQWFNLNEWVNEFTNGQYKEFNLQFILGLLMAPVAWLLGVNTNDLIIVGQLLGEKTVLNEFYAYAQLGELKEAGLFSDTRSLLIATYALCGFANLSSIGIQIGGIGALVPSRRKELSELGLKAMIAGTIASFMTAIIAGMLYIQN